MKELYQGGAFLGRALQWDWSCPNLIFLAVPAGPAPGLHPACSRGSVQNAYQGRGVQSFLYSIKPFLSLVSCLYTLKHPLLLKLYQFLGGRRHFSFSFDLNFSVAFHLTSRQQHWLLSYSKSKYLCVK